MKHLMIAALAIVLYGFDASAQSKNEIVSQDIRIKIDSTLIKDSVEVAFTLQLGELKDVKWIKLRYGTEAGKGNLVAMDLQVVESGNKQYLQSYYDKTLFPIVNGTVEVKKLSSPDALTTTGYLEIKVKGVENKEIFKVQKANLK